MASNDGVIYVCEEWSGVKPYVMGLGAIVHDTSCFTHLCL